MNIIINYPLMCVVLVVVYSVHIYSIESKQMNNRNTSRCSPSEWLAHVKEATLSKSSGMLTTTDTTGVPVIIDWQITDILSPHLAAFKKDVSGLAANATAAMEIQLLHKHPQAVSSGGFLKACEPLFAQGVDQVNWQLVEETLQTSIKQFYLMDLSKFGADIINKLIDDIYFFAAIKDQKTNELLGFIMTSITPALPYGDIKVINVVIAQKERGRGLEALLLGSIFKIISGVKRLFTITRLTNVELLKAYTAYGFVEDLSPVSDPHHKVAMEYVIALEYKAAQSSMLQKIALTLSE